ncbi:DUF6037 family protein [Trueperella pyogenes]|uniref:DUF6037 family protein n=1 Tax=Trueperella pyogenes TaxID=1661 RepID=UPI00345DB717
MANLGTQKDWMALTHTWHLARENWLTRFSWIHRDRQHLIQFVFDEITNPRPGNPVAEMLITPINTARPWSQIVGLAVSKTGNLFPTTAPSFDERGLKEALGIRPNPYSHSPWDLLQWITRALESSTNANLSRRTYPHEISTHARRIIPEEEKIYYIGAAKRGGPTIENLTKTRILIGADAAEYCKRHGISTHWSDSPKDFSLTQWNQLFDSITQH